MRPARSGGRGRGIAGRESADAPAPEIADGNGFAYCRNP